MWLSLFPFSLFFFFFLFFPRTLIILHTHIIVSVFYNIHILPVVNWLKSFHCFAVFFYFLISNWFPPCFCSTQFHSNLLFFLLLLGAYRSFLEKIVENLTISSIYWSVFEIFLFFFFSTKLSSIVLLQTTSSSIHINILIFVHITG